MELGSVSVWVFLRVHRDDREVDGFWEATSSAWLARICWRISEEVLECTDSDLAVVVIRTGDSLVESESDGDVLGWIWASEEVMSLEDGAGGNPEACFSGSFPLLVLLELDIVAARR